MMKQVQLVLTFKKKKIKYGNKKGLMQPTSSYQCQECHFFQSSPQSPAQEIQKSDKDETYK